MRRSQLAGFLLYWFFIFGLSGCNELTSLQKMAEKAIEGVLNDLPKSQSSVDTTPAPSAEPSAPADNRIINGEFIKELFKVTLERDLRNEQEFTKYMNILDQGAHYEGIYNGIVYSEEYRAREKGVASVPVIKAYIKIMSELMLNQKFDPIHIKKQSDTSSGAVIPGAPTPTPTQPTLADRAAAEAEAEKEALTSSLFLLKRRLGEEVLKTISLKRVYREKLATWYGRFAPFTNSFGVSFGLKERDQNDEYFHYKWALEADEDRIKWEALNRAHRILNAKATQ